MLNKVLFFILVYCLPELMALALLGLIGFIVCKVTNRKSIGLMILLLVVFCGIDIIVSKVKTLLLGS